MDQQRMVSEAPETIDMARLQEIGRSSPTPEQKDAFTNWYREVSELTDKLRESADAPPRSLLGAWLVGYGIGEMMRAGVTREVLEAEITREINENLRAYADVEEAVQRAKDGDKRAQLALMMVSIGMSSALELYIEQLRADEAATAAGDVSPTTEREPATAAAE